MKLRMKGMKMHQNQDNVWNKSCIIYYKDPVDEAKFEKLQYDVAIDPAGRSSNCILFSDITKNFVVQNFELTLSTDISIEDMTVESIVWRSAKTAHMVSDRYGVDAIVCLKLPGESIFTIDGHLWPKSKNEEDEKKRRAKYESIEAALKDTKSELFKELLGSFKKLVA